MSSATKSRGTKIQVDTGGGTFADIPEAKDITFASPRTDEIDVTNQDSASGTKEFIAGDNDFGTVTFSCNYIPANARHVAILSDQVAGTKRQWRVLLASPHSLAQEFEAFVQTAGRNATVSGVYELNVTLRVTGLPAEDTTP